MVARSLILGSAHTVVETVLTYTQSSIIGEEIRWKTVGGESVVYEGNCNVQGFWIFMPRLPLVF